MTRNGETRKSRVNIPHELYLDSKYFRGTDKVDKIRFKKTSYRRRLHEFNKPHYRAKDAEIKALKRTKKQSLILATASYDKTRKYVLERLSLRWSPEQISGRIKLENKLPYVSARAIYAFIYLPENKRLIKHLRRRGKPKRLKTDLVFNRTKDKRRITSITYDNGSEFTMWQQTEKQLHTTIYFANPYHSWERGRNENANGLIRDFFPKETDFKKNYKSQCCT